MHAASLAADMYITTCAAAHASGFQLPVYSQTLVQYLSPPVPLHMPVDFSCQSTPRRLCNTLL